MITLTSFLKQTKKLNLKCSLTIFCRLLYMVKWPFLKRPFVEVQIRKFPGVSMVKKLITQHVECELKHNQQQIISLLLTQHNMLESLHAGHFDLSRFFFLKFKGYLLHKENRTRTIEISGRI